MALTYGPEAAALFSGGGTVHSVLSNCIYLEGANGRMTGVVDASQPDGPLTLRVIGLGEALRVLDGGNGRAFAGDGTFITIGEGVAINLRQAKPWVPPTVTPIGAGPTDLRRLERLLTTARHDELPARVRKSAIALNDAWRSRDALTATQAALSLLGLGPGLTPSGDDLLAGLLAVTQWSQAYSESASTIGSAVSQAVLREAPLRTTKLSSRLLANAANGLLFEPAMQLGAALFSGQRNNIEPAALRLFKIGHSSGADMAIGILLGGRVMSDE